MEAQAPLVPTAASDLSAVSEVVDLPVAQGPGGTPFRMRLVAPTIEALSRARGELLAAGRDESFDGAQPDLSAEMILGTLKEQMSRLLAAGANTEPAIALDQPEDGKVLWENLHLKNRTFIVTRICRLAGVGPGRTDALATFSAVEAGGRGDGPGAGGDLPVDATPA